MDADFDQLAGRHEVRIRASGQPTKEFSTDNPLAGFESILEARRGSWSPTTTHTGSMPSRRRFARPSRAH